MLLTPLFLPPKLQGAVGAPGPKGARGSAGPPVSIWILGGGGLHGSPGWGEVAVCTHGWLSPSCISPPNYGSCVGW